MLGVEYFLVSKVIKKRIVGWEMVFVIVILFFFIVESKRLKVIERGK